LGQGVLCDKREREPRQKKLTTFEEVMIISAVKHERRDGCFGFMKEKVLTIAELHHVPKDPALRYMDETNARLVENMAKARKELVEKTL
jgi:hypothetical protein